MNYRLMMKFMKNIEEKRVTWAFMTLAAWLTAITFLYFSLNNSRSDTLMVIESTHHGIWNIPFPAVTICNINRISRSAAIKMAKTLKRPKDVSIEDAIRMLRTLVTAYHSFGANTTHATNELEELFAMNNITVEYAMRNLTPSCNDMIQRCMWKSSEVNCESMFQTVISNHGYCCSFNYYGRKHNFAPKYGYTFPKQPRRVSACGYNTALSVLLQPNVPDYHTTLISSFGVWISIHDPYDYPDDNAETKLVSTDTEVYLTVTPEATYATSNVRALKIKKRLCLFKDESIPDEKASFRVMEKYSYLNCLNECRARVSLEKCGCIPYNFPNNNIFPICDVADWACLRVHNQTIFGSLPGLSIDAILPNMTYSPCGCLPDCELFEYPAEGTSGEISKGKESNDLGLFKKTTLKDYSIVHVFFSDLKCTHFRRDVVMNWHSLMATCGGLLGLFVGFSIVGGFEFVYFFSIRLIFDKYSKESQKYKGALKKINNNMIIKNNFDKNIFGIKRNKIPKTVYNEFTY